MTFDPGTDANALKLALGYLEARNYRRAEEVLREALVHSPHNARLLTELARAQHFQGDNAAAEQSVCRAVAFEPEDAYPMRIYASVLDALGRRREALTWARKAIDAAPNDYTMHYEYARILATAGDPGSALPVVEEAVRLAPTDADAHDLRGNILGMLGKWSESTAAHEEALRLQPGNARALHNIAVNRANRRNLSGALAGFTQAAQLDPHIGGDVRKSITATVRQWLAWMTIVAWGALWLSVQIERNNEGPTNTSGARVIAGLGFIVLLVMFAWLARSLPRNLWAPVLRQREFRSLKIYLGLGLLVLAVLGALAFGAPVNLWVLAGALLVTVIVSWVAPRFDKDL
jgi:tetratricopeptide (TPR) repeat protein